MAGDRGFDIQWAILAFPLALSPYRSVKVKRDDHKTLTRVLFE